MDGTALLFPGQGAQFVGMGRALHDADEATRDLFASADAALGFPLSDILFHGPAERLTETAIAQPALLLHAIAVLDAGEGGRDGVVAGAGHSLGEWAAYVAAGAFSLEDALRLVHLRGRLMQEAVPLGEGAMAAVIGLDEEGVRAVCDAAAAHGVVVPATFNGRGHIAISGAAAAVTRAGEIAVDRGAAKVIPLDVSAPFHSPLMEPARTGLRAALADVDIAAPAFPVCSNIDGSFPDSPDAIRAALVNQLVEPVRWEECLRALAAAGVTAFRVVGAGNSLARMVKRLRIGPAVTLRSEDSVLPEAH